MHRAEEASKSAAKSMVRVRDVDDLQNQVKREPMNFVGVDGQHTTPISVLQDLPKLDLHQRYETSASSAGLCQRLYANSSPLRVISDWVTLIVESPS